MTVVTVVDRKGEKVAAISCTTIGELRLEVSSTLGLNVNRIAVKHHSSDLAANYRMNDDSASLASVKVTSKTLVEWKDLGPQIGYRTVFYLEYLGPMVFVALYALFPGLIYGEGAANLDFELSQLNGVASLSFWCWMGHFAKREFETAFVHKFSRPTMPLSNLFKNCTYYWSFGLVIGYFLCSPYYLGPEDVSTVNFGLALFCLSELGNLIIHLKLASMRPAEGSKRRDIPKGFGFDLVACPNYTFEVLSWVGFSIMTGLFTSWLFTIIGFVQMSDWAQKKHREYKKTYEREYTRLNRKAIVPFVY
eukprot:GSChrysophyteH1.ASY1.ANO1.73.1 assembled CDS